MEIQTYIKQLERDHAAGNATEHTHRPALKTLLESALSGVLATNEPKQTECGAPDFVLTRNEIPIGYIEAKDIGKNLDDPAHKEQLNRYTKSLDNLIFTNYTEFRLFRDGEQVAAVNIAGQSRGRIKPKPGDFDAFADILTTFADYQGQTITTAADLAKRMAVKARMLAGAITQALTQDQDATGNSSVSEMQSALLGQLEAFRKHLIHDIQPANFADIYAQTVAYGMFAARLHDPTPATFSRKEAAELIPANNPFLRRFFQHIAGYELDKRIRWIVDDLADVFRAADVGELMKGYGKATQRNDPFLHFYETFLGEYDSKLRKSRGVYYTPEPVVNFIVRAVDEILRAEFNLPDGLADTGKTTIEVQRPDAKGKAAKLKKEIHKVQILDPATGTGTFLAAIVQQIYESRFSNQKGIWPDYVRKELIPRLNGFEVLMASYAMAHTKLEMVLRDSGCELGDERLRIFLTNSLEEHHPDTGTLFAQWLSAEANEANAIKRDTPVMVVIGNPPYAVSSSNKGKWIQGLLGDYKKDLNEKKLNLDDDYIKFIRYGEHLVEKTGEGILAYISNNSFLDGLTHRQMRKRLLETFDKIYILDLHGNSKKKEIAPDGSVDKNVFDIQQGVSINLFVKTGKKDTNTLARVFHSDLYGQRESKYEYLLDCSLGKISYKELRYQDPYYFFTQKDLSSLSEYEKGFAMNTVFGEYNSGIQTKCDELSVKFSQKELEPVIDDFLSLEVDELKRKYHEKKESSGWNFASAKADLMKNEFQYTEMLYRPFDVRKTVYTNTSSGFIGRPRKRTMRHMIVGKNLGICFMRQVFQEGTYNHIFVSRYVNQERTFYSNRGATSFSPLYLYVDTEQQSIDGQKTRKPNLAPNIVQTIADNLNLRFTPEKENDNKTFAPIDLLDYIYAVLHSPAYRERYKEFLKIDFPRVPYPTDKNKFRKLAQLGGELRTLHLLENPILNTRNTAYPETGDNIITKPEYQLTDPKTRLGKVKINKTQYFQNIPEPAWTFHIGGYQPAQKWLKDRKGRVLTPDDVTHYQKIIVALSETGRLMGEIDIAVDFSET